VLDAMRAAAIVWRWWADVCASRKATPAVLASVCACGDGVIPRGLECGVHMHELLPVVRDLVPASRHGYVAIECRRHDHGRTTLTRPIFWLLFVSPPPLPPFCCSLTPSAAALPHGHERPASRSVPSVLPHADAARTPSSDGRGPDSEQQRSQPTPFLPSMRACRGSQRECPAARECPCPYGTIFGYTNERDTARTGGMGKDGSLLGRG
jgi:hypothetical protein